MILAFWVVFYGTLFIIAAVVVCKGHNAQMEHMDKTIARNKLRKGSQVKCYVDYHISDNGDIVYQ